MAKAELVGITKPARIDIGSTEDLIAYCARVSNPKNQTNVSTSKKLLEYLMEHAHWSPFEMVHVVIEVTTTRDIARQILRHRSFSFQEFSQRYANPTHMKFELREARLQDPKNRQNSIEIDDENLQREWDKRQQRVIDAALAEYQWAIDNGIAKEQARCVLPEGNTPSVMYVSGTLRSWYHYCKLRTGNGTQKEHQIVANACWEILQQNFSFLN